jgi:hypothetical protein
MSGLYLASCGISPYLVVAAYSYGILLRPWREDQQSNPVESVVGIAGYENIRIATRAVVMAVSSLWRNGFLPKMVRNTQALRFEGVKRSCIVSSYKHYM